MKARQFRYYDLLVHIFVVLLLISNLVGQKITAIGPVRVGGAQLLFPLTYIFGDVFTEVYGYGARRAIWIGFFASTLLSLMCRVHGVASSGARLEQSRCLSDGFYQVPRMVAASLIAYWCGEFANSFVLAEMKLWTNGKYLWTRSGIHRGRTSSRHHRLHDAGLRRSLTRTLIRSAHLLGVSFQVVYEITSPPATYAIVNFLKRHEGVDTFDRGTSSNPFPARSKSRGIE
jgi:hypothetical protein